MRQMQMDQSFTHFSPSFTKTSAEERIVERVNLEKGVSSFAFLLLKAAQYNGLSTIVKEAIGRGRGCLIGYCQFGGGL